MQKKYEDIFSENAILATKEDLNYPATIENVVVAADITDVDVPEDFIKQDQIEARNDKHKTGHYTIGLSFEKDTLLILQKPSALTNKIHKVTKIPYNKIKTIKFIMTDDAFEIILHYGHINHKFDIYPEVLDKNNAETKALQTSIENALLPALAVIDPTTYEQLNQD